MIKKIGIDSGTICYRDNELDGPAILFIHGNSLSQSIFDKQFSGGLAERYRLLAIDLPGHGGSDWSDNSKEIYTIPGFASAITNFIDVLGLRDLIVVGVSLGGHIAIEATTMCDRIKGILISGAPPAGHPFQPEKAFKLKPEDAVVLLKGNVSDNEAAALAYALLGRDGGEEWEKAKFDILSTDPSVRDCLGKCMMGGEYLDEVEIIRNLKIPVAVVHGVNEGVVNLDYFSLLEIPTLWRRSVQMIPEAGHMAQLDNFESYNKIIGEFAGDIFGLPVTG